MEIGREEAGEGPRPGRVDALNPATAAAWLAIRRMPEGLVLYGGTAVALYLGHRESQDLDFVTKDGYVTPETMGEIEGLEVEEAQGGPGMADGMAKGPAGKVRITMMEAGWMVPLPARDPVFDEAGRAVAHPVDLLAAKMTACVNREKWEDYVDLAHGWSKWQACWKEGLEIAASMIGGEGRVAKALALRPSEVDDRLTDTERQWLEQAARRDESPTGGRRRGGER